MISINKSSELAKETFPESFWIGIHPVVQNIWFKEVFSFFEKWRGRNNIVPRHIAVYEFLFKRKMDWGNLKSKDLAEQPYYLNNENDKTSEINFVAVIFGLAQIYFDGRLDVIMRDIVICSIDREKQLIDKTLINSSSIVEFEDMFGSINIITFSGNDDKAIREYWENKE